MLCLLARSCGPYQSISCGGRQCSQWMYYGQWHGRKVSLAWQTSLCCGPALLPRSLDPFTLAMASLPWVPFFLTPVLCALQGSGDSSAGGGAQPVKAWRERAQQRQRFWSRTTGFQMGRSLTEWGRNKGANQVGLTWGSHFWLDSFQVTGHQSAHSSTGGRDRSPARWV